MKKAVITITFVLGGFMPLFSQEEDPIKKLSETKKESKYCFYPSTLRMINLDNNEEIDEFANSIEKVLIYRLSTEAGLAGEINRAYAQMDFEEYARAYGGNQSLLVMGKESGRRSTLVGLVSLEGSTYTFYLKGKLPWQKIPSLLMTLQNANLLKVPELDLSDNDD